MEPLMKIYIAIAALWLLPSISNAQSVEIQSFGYGNSDRFTLITPKEDDQAAVQNFANSPLISDQQSEKNYKLISPDITSQQCSTPAYVPHHAMPAKYEYRRRKYYNLMLSAACAYGINPKLLDALIIQESHYNPVAKSSAGALGLAQLMPNTAKYLNVSNPYDPQQNLFGGAKYLREQLDNFQNWQYALAAYNAGPGAVKKYRGIPPYLETQKYVKAISISLKTLSY